MHLRILHRIQGRAIWATRLPVSFLSLFSLVSPGVDQDSLTPENLICADLNYKALLASQAGDGGSTGHSGRALLFVLRVFSFSEVQLPMVTATATSGPGQQTQPWDEVVESEYTGGQAAPTPGSPMSGNTHRSSLNKNSEWGLRRWLSGQVC